MFEETGIHSNCWLLAKNTTSTCDLEEEVERGKEEEGRREWRKEGGGSRGEEEGKSSGLREMSVKAGRRGVEGGKDEEEQREGVEV